MADSRAEFSQRVGTITKRHSRMRAGVRYRMRDDGLIVAEPRRRVPRFPLRGVTLLFAAGIAFKVFLYVYLGGISYSERVAELQAGSVVEQAGAWVMKADPATLWVVDQLRPWLP